MTKNYTHSDEEVKEMLWKGIRLLKEGKPLDSINQFFKPIIEHFNEKYINTNETIYCARSISETISYLMIAAVNSKPAIAISTEWADAYYFQAFAYIELKDINKAKFSLKMAIDLSPHNAHYLNELGYLYQIEKQWEKALNVFIRAEEASRRHSPKETKTAELTRAIRGIGFVFIELGRYHDAQDRFLQCLRINPGDKMALSELEYINDKQSGL